MFGSSCTPTMEKQTRHDIKHMNTCTNRLKRVLYAPISSSNLPASSSDINVPVHCTVNKAKQDVFTLILACISLPLTFKGAKNSPFISVSRKRGSLKKRLTQGNSLSVCSGECSASCGDFSSPVSPVYLST